LLLPACRQPVPSKQAGPLACAGILLFNIAISNNIAVSKRNIERLRAVATPSDQRSPAQYMINKCERRSASGKMNFHHSD
jgi:hypothetical protein